MSTHDEHLPDGSALLTELHTTLCRYVVMPSPEATDAVVLWIAATHAQPAWEHATRLGITGPEKRCGKSRLLELIKATCHAPLPAVHATTAALYRSINSVEPPTLLFDEVDTIFGTKRAAEANEDLRALINAGHARGWPVLRCVGPNQEVKAFASFAMAALAGIGDLPDTIADRAVNIRMRRRAPGESVHPFRTRRDGPALADLRSRLGTWAHAHLGQLREVEPDMPVEDRAADTWESLIAIADLAGGEWPERGRLAAKVLTAAAAEGDTQSSLKLRLLGDLRAVFGNASKLHTTTILERLIAIEDAPWSNMYGRTITAGDLSRYLRDYSISSKDVRENSGPNRKGYTTDDLHDAWMRYLPATSATAVTPQLSLVVAT